MDTGFDNFVSRRRFLQASASFAAAAALHPGHLRASGVDEHRLAVAPGYTQLTGRDGLRTAVWAYDGKVPGPTLRLRQGEPVRIVVDNRLDEDTTVHWHGIRLPNAMDGVPGLTQAPIKPGESSTID